MPQISPALLLAARATALQEKLARSSGPTAGEYSRAAATPGNIQLMNPPETESPLKAFSRLKSEVLPSAPPKPAAPSGYAAIPQEWRDQASGSSMGQQGIADYWNRYYSPLSEEQRQIYQSIPQEFKNRIAGLKGDQLASAVDYWSKHYAGLDPMEQRALSYAGHSPESRARLSGELVIPGRSTLNQQTGQVRRGIMMPYDLGTARGQGLHATADPTGPIPNPKGHDLSGYFNELSEFRKAVQNDPSGAQFDESRQGQRLSPDEYEDLSTYWDQPKPTQPPAWQPPAVKAGSWVAKPGVIQSANEAAASRGGTTTVPTTPPPEGGTYGTAPPAAKPAAPYKPPIGSATGEPLLPLRRKPAAPYTPPEAPAAPAAPSGDPAKQRQAAHAMTGWSTAPQRWLGFAGLGLGAAQGMMNPATRDSMLHGYRGQPGLLDAGKQMATAFTGIPEAALDAGGKVMSHMADQGRQRAAARPAAPAAPPTAAQKAMRQAVSAGREWAGTSAPAATPTAKAPAARPTPAAAPAAAPAAPAAPPARGSVADLQQMLQSGTTRSGQPLSRSRRQALQYRIGQMQQPQQTQQRQNTYLQNYWKARGAGVQRGAASANAARSMMGRPVQQPAAPQQAAAPRRPLPGAAQAQQAARTNIGGPYSTPPAQRSRRTGVQPQPTV